MIDSEHSAAGFYSQHHVDTLSAISSIISTKYSNSRAIVELEETITKLERVKTLQNAVFDIAELVYTTQSVVEGIISLVYSLHMEVVAEGIELPARKDILETMGAKYGQGFHYYKPVPVAQAMALLRASTPAESACVNNAARRGSTTAPPVYFGAENPAWRTPICPPTTTISST